MQKTYYDPTFRYKERLNLKFFKTYNPASTLDGERWIFIANNMDDFRTSLPPRIDGSKMVVKRKVNRVPLLGTSTSSITKQTPIPIHHSDPGKTTLYSKMGPQRQLKESEVNAAEKELLKHPFRLFPHMGDSIPQELRDDVVKMLDPHLDTTLSKTEPNQNSSSETCEETVAALGVADAEPSDDSRPNIYRWPLVKTVEEINNEQSVLASQKVISPAQESRVNDVTHQLVQWAKELGGNEEIHIDDGMIKNLFSSDYETKPFLSEPLHVVELTNIPMQLTSLKQQSAHLEGHRYNQRAASMYHNTDGSMAVPRIVKSRYGAWYLPVSVWRKLRNEPLTLPKSSSHAKSEQLPQAMEDETLHNLHGAKAFKEFLASKPGARIPQFLTEMKSKRM